MERKDQISNSKFWSLGNVLDKLVKRWCAGLPIKWSSPVTLMRKSPEALPQHRETRVIFPAQTACEGLSWLTL